MKLAGLSGSIALSAAVLWTIAVGIASIAGAVGGATESKTQTSESASGSGESEQDESTSADWAAACVMLGASAVMLAGVATAAGAVILAVVHFAKGRSLPGDRRAAASGLLMGLVLLLLWAGSFILYICPGA